MHVEDAGLGVEARGSAAERIVETLLHLGVEVVFGLPGVHNLPLWEVLAGSNLRLVGVRHEQAAVYAADGYARAGGRLGVALVTTGPGAANTLGAVGEAMASGSPVLTIASDVPSALRRDGRVRGLLHECSDQRAMFDPLTRLAVEATSGDDSPLRVAEAGRAALRAPAGPTYVGVPTDLLAEPSGPPDPAQPDLVAAAPGGDVAAAARILDAAERPLVWAGGGALWSGASESLGRVATRLRAPVLTTYSARGLISPGHPCFVPGPAHEPSVGQLWDEADVVLAVGTDFDGMSTQNWAMPPPPRLLAINVDAEDAAKNYEPDLTLVGDADETLAALVEYLGAGDASPTAIERLDGMAEAIRASVEQDEPQAADMLASMDDVLPPETVVVADMCIPGYWLAGYRRVPLPRALAYPMGWGTLGFAFPASLGAALAGSAPTVCVCGDGGFMFACGELATAVQERIPITVVLVDDGGYGMLRFDQRRAGHASFGVDLHRPDFVALARSFGVEASRVQGFGADFGNLLRRSVAADSPQLIVVEARLKPPRTTSPRWYRRDPGQPAEGPGEEQR